MSDLGSTDTSVPIAQRVARSTVWVMGMRIGVRLVSVVRVFILARLLGPEALGVVGTALLLLAMLETFTNPGMNEAIIQRPKIDRSDLDTAWTLQMLRGLALGLLIFMVAPWVAAFYELPELDLMIRLVAVAVAIKGFLNIGLVLLSKEIQMGREFGYTLVSALIDLVVSVALAIVLRSPIGLLIGFIAGQVSRVVLSYVVHPHRPRFLLDLTKSKVILRFGRWITASNILVFIITHGDDLVVAKMLGPVQLGLYQLAYTLSNTPATEVSNVLQRITFPLFSKLQTDQKQLRKAFIRVYTISTALSVLLCGIIWMMAPEIVGLLLGVRWAETVPAIKVLVIWGLVRSLGAVTSPIMQALGRPEIVTSAQAIMAVGTVLLIIPFTRQWGLVGASYAVLIPAIVAHIIRYPVVAKALQMTAWALWLRVMISVLCLIPMGLFWYTLQLAAPGLHPFVSVSLNVAVGGGAYVGLHVLADWYFRAGIVNSLKSILIRGGVL